MYQMLRGYIRAQLVSCPFVRESPPPTPREAYLPQRLERAHQEGTITSRASSASNQRSSQDKAEPQAIGLTQSPRESRGEQDQEAPLKKEARSGSDPKSLTRLREYKSVST